MRKASNLAISGEVPTEELARLFVNLKTTRGWDGLSELIYNTAASLNGFDKYGHFGRTLVTLSTCLEYKANPAGYSGCVARFHGANASATAETSARALVRLINQLRAEGSGGLAGSEAAPSLATARPTAGTAPVGRGGGEGEPGLGEATTTEGTEPLLDYLLGQ